MTSLCSTTIPIPRFPSFKTTDGTVLTNAANYTNFSASQGQSTNSDTEWAGKADFSFPLSIAGDDGQLGFGGSVRERNRKARASSADFNDIAGTYADFSTGVDQIYYNAHYDIGPKPLFSALAALSTGP